VTRRPAASLKAAPTGSAPDPDGPPLAQGGRLSERLYDLFIRAKHSVRPPAGIDEGTRRHVPSVQPGVCLVGCGWWGGVHALVLKQQGGRIRRYFTSRTPERARDFARRFDGRVFDRLEDALADCRRHRDGHRAAA